MVLKTQDIVILLKLVTSGEIELSYPSLVHDIFMSVSEAHAGVKRAGAALLIDLQRRVPPWGECRLRGTKILTYVDV
jgi:hypothetical protein